MKIVNWRNHNFSKLCLGTVQFGFDYGIANKSGEVAQEEVDKILKYVLQEGINCLDTGSMYGNSEIKIGNFIKKSNCRDFNIISKVKKDFFSLNLNEAIVSMDSSLSNLKSENLFALLLHNIEPLKNWNIKYQNIINILKLKDKIRYFGVSIYTNEEFNLALMNKDIDIIQLPFSLLDQRAIKYDWFRKAEEKNKLIFIRSIYLQGLILMDIDKIPSSLYHAKKYLEIIETIAKKLDISKNLLALSFVDNIAKNSIILFGCDNLIQAKQNVQNFYNIKNLDNSVIDELRFHMSSIDETIYNPTKWGLK